MAAIATPRFKLKQAPTDIWSTRERLSLASSVMRSGDQNWVSVSRAIRHYGEPNRPSDWFSQKNCALQYSDLLEKADIPKRKRGERDLETPGEYIVRKLIQERIEELKVLIAQDKQQYKKLKHDFEEVQSGASDHRLHEIWDEILRERERKEQAAEQHQVWLQERAARQAAQAALKTGKIPSLHKRGVNRRASVGVPSSPRLEQSADLEGHVEPPSIGGLLHVEANNFVEEASPLDVGNLVPNANTVSTALTTTVVTIPSSTVPSSHSSPLLNTLLRSSSHVCQTSIPITPKEVSPRSQASVTSPTITSLLSSPNMPPCTLASSVANLLTTALSGPPDHESNGPRPPITSPSQGAPTLLKLLDMPLGSPGKLPPLPEMTYKENLSTVSPTSKEPCIPMDCDSIVSQPEETKPVIEPEDETVTMEEVVQPSVEPEQMDTSHEDAAKEELEIVRESEPAEDDLSKIEIIEEVVSTVIEVEVKDEPPADIVEVLEVVEESHELKDAECIEFVEEEVITETVQQPEFGQQEEIQTVEVEEPVVHEQEEQPKTELQESPAEDDVKTETIVEEVTEPEVSEQLPEIVPSPSDSHLVVNASEIEKISESPLNSPLEFTHDSAEEMETGRETMEDHEIEEEEEEETEEILHTYDETHSATEDNIAESEPERKVGFLEIEESSSNIDKEIEVPMVSTDVQPLVSAAEDDEKEIEMPSVALIFGSRTESGYRGRRGRGRGGRRGGRMHGSRSSSTFSSCDDSAIEEKVDESETETSENRKSFESKDSLFRKDRPGHFFPDGIRRKRARKKKEDREIQDKEEYDRQSTPRQAESRKDDEVDRKEDNVQTSMIAKMREFGGMDIQGRETDDEIKEDVLVGRIMNTDSIPNSPASLSASGDDADGGRDYRLWKKAIMLVWRSIANHKYANVFLHAVTEEMAPGYHGVVCRPMDLVSIKKNIENGVIRTTQEFERDVMLMFQNAIMYNNSDHDVYKMAIEMQKEVIGYIQDFVTTQLMVQSSGSSKVLRRETREQYQKRDGFSDKSTTGTPQPPEGEKRRKQLSESSEGGSAKKRRTRADE